MLWKRKPSAALADSDSMRRSAHFLFWLAVCPRLGSLFLPTFGMQNVAIFFARCRITNNYFITNFHE